MSTRSASIWMKRSFPASCQAHSGGPCTSHPTSYDTDGSWGRWTSRALNM